MIFKLKLKIKFNDIWKGSQKKGCVEPYNATNNYYITSNYSQTVNIYTISHFLTNILEKFDIKQSYEYFYVEYGKKFENEDVYEDKRDFI